ncbi:MAG: hypothetical protein JNJ92_03215 [Altererythrobacter sp.]|nr:hypothetical protein [Altererythrobacter sp.]
MFEGPLPAARPAGSDESPILRQLRWTDLVARIAATRDMRSAGPMAIDEPNASFAAFHRDDEQQGEGAVNRDALSHGKLARLVGREAANSSGDGDRETQ